MVDAYKLYCSVIFVNCFFTTEFKDDATDSSPFIFFVFFSSCPDDDDILLKR